MFSISIIVLTILILTIQSQTQELRLTFYPDETYFEQNGHVEIFCELVNPVDHDGVAQLWHVDLQTHTRTLISRALLNSQVADAPKMFRSNQNQHFQYIGKNRFRIIGLLPEESSQYECDCPDCETPLVKQVKVLKVMTKVKPTLSIDSEWELKENVPINVRCEVDGFYPYVDHSIIQHHHDITHKGTSSINHTDAYPQRFSWEASLTPTAEWHNTELQCIVTEGNSKEIERKHLNVQFAPRFDSCNEKQNVDLTKQKPTIECSYSGNPEPRLIWLRQTNENSIESDDGITIQKFDGHHGTYRSVVTFDREKLSLVPLTTTTKSPSMPTGATSQKSIAGENYYQQLLNGGFVVRLIVDEEIKASQKISILTDPKKIQAKTVDNSSTRTTQSFSTFIIAFSASILLHSIKKND